ncbi:MAG: NAD kinase [Bacteroidales bacterium]|nr:NAD kinase [Bacteroidales bacterium]
MQIAIYGRNFHSSCRENVATLLSRLNSMDVDVLIFKPFYDFLQTTAGLRPKIRGIFESHSDLPPGIDFLFSIGGDGTFLETLSIVRDSGIPVVGLNTGRLGFLSYISQDSLEESLDSIFSGQFDLEERMLLQVNSNGASMPDFNIALNEVRLYKNSASLVTIHVHIDEDFLSSYWADGLILSTPTGSTAYNLSVGGPIVVPESDTMVLSPIAPHNLTVRPLVLPGKAALKFTVDTREPVYQLALDSRSWDIPVSEKITISRAPYALKMVRIENNSFYSTLRNKFLWGIDKRN